MAGRKFRLSIRVDLRESDSRFEFSRSRLKDRSYGSAWPAPRRPEIHEKRDIAFERMTGEPGRRERQGLTNKEVPSALATLAVLRLSRSGYAMQRIAVRTE